MHIEQPEDVIKQYGFTVSDVTGLSSDRTFRKQCKENELVLVSRHLIKINKRHREQERLLLITNEAVYNISGKKIKRKIPIECVYGVTISRRSSEFVIHIPEEYDYRYDSKKSPEVRDLMVHYLVLAFKLKMKSGLRFYFVENEELEQFTLQEQQFTKEKQLQYHPKKIAEILTLQNFQLSFINNTYCSSQQQLLFIRNPNSLRIRLNEDFSKQLGLMQGSLCKTYLVVQKVGVQQQQLLVLKTIDKNALDIDMDLLEHLLKEYEVHPFVETLEMVFNLPHKILLMFELKRGGDLYQHLRINGAFSEDQARFIVVQVACALSSLHEKGIVYGDLKPENILMDEQGYVSLTDFGYGKLRIHRLYRKLNQLNFTPEYCPPEYVRNNELTRMSDWYQLGALLYEMLVGIPLFYHQTSPEITIELSLTQQLHLPRDIDISKNCVKFMAQLLNADSSKRLGFKADFKDILAHPWLQGVDMMAHYNRNIEPLYKPKVDDQQINANYFTMEQIPEEERSW